MNETQINTTAYRFTAERDGEEVGHAYLFLIINDLHSKPYGLLEDVFVEENYRSQGIGTELITAVIEKAKEVGCYKLIATSRDSRTSVHVMYKKIGFTNYGAAFRIDF